MGQHRVRGTPRAAGFVLMTVIASSCAPTGLTRIAVEPGAQRESLLFTRNELAVQYCQAIDRYTYFGPASGSPNMLHTVGLDRTAQPGEYLFYGGCYSWTAPQNGSGADKGGWVDPQGGPLGWPPDPAMDIGPCDLVTSGDRGFTVRGPVQRTGLRETKTFEIVGPRSARLTYRLDNRGPSPVLAGPWLNTAVAPGSVIAFRMGEGAAFEVRGAMGENAAASFTGALGPSGHGGWRSLDLSQHQNMPETKVFIDAGDRPAEIAIWRDGWWLHRRLTGGDSASHSRQREHGEGPVAFYVHSGLGIVEAELVAPFGLIDPGRAHEATELWTLIRASGPNLDALPR